jgi:hypothetical protein
MNRRELLAGALALPLVPVVASVQAGTVLQFRAVGVARADSAYLTIDTTRGSEAVYGTFETEVDFEIVRA